VTKILMINIINKISQMNTGHYHKHEINTAFLIFSRDSSIRDRVARRFHSEMGK